MAHLLSSTISGESQRQVEGRKMLTMAVKHKDNISGSGILLTTNQLKLGQYTSNVSLHADPAPSHSWTQTYTDQHVLMFSGNQGKIITKFYNQLCLQNPENSVWGYTICLILSLLQVPLQLPECQ